MQLMVDKLNVKHSKLAVVNLRKFPYSDILDE